MSAGDFHLCFASNAQLFNINFQEQKTASSETVLVNGKNYSLQGDSSKISWLRNNISNLSSSENITLEDLQSKLRKIGAIDLSVSHKVDTISDARFSPSADIDIKAANEAYLTATEEPKESHVSVGILRPNGQTINFRLGKDEAYGAHRIGSVTKTFTTFLALKLIKDGVISLNTKCGDLIDDSILQRVFAEPEKAKEMTLEQLLSHTSGLEYSDHQIDDDPAVKLSTLHERFIHQGKLVYRYEHKHSPGSGTALYSNLGFDVAAWMMEVAYNGTKSYEIPKVPFSKIIKDELFSKVFTLSEDTRISPGPSGDGDVIQAGCGDMVTTVQDLLKVAHALQKGEENLVGHFGEGWQKTMLTQRASDGETKVSGLGCEPNASSIQFSGLNYEIFEDGKGRDVTAHVAFPLQKNQPGLVAMCDSNALGPEAEQVKFRNELRKLAGLSV